MSVRTPPVAVEYPETDGKPMAETETHLHQMLDLIFVLRQYFKDDPQAYACGNMLMYYEEDNPKAVVAPDVFLVRGVPKTVRSIYKTWEEGKGPDLVIEVTSKSTRLEDLGTKKAIYEMLAVKEYLQFDPLEEYLRPALIGYSLKDGGYVRMETAHGRLWSEASGLEFGIVAGRLRVFLRGKRFPLATAEEVARLKAEVEEALEQEKRARQAAEAEVQRLRTELGRRQKG